LQRSRRRRTTGRCTCRVRQLRWRLAQVNALCVGQRLRTMSIPRKGSRLLTVGEHRYRWYVRSKPTYSQGVSASPMRVAIERADVVPGRVLLVRLSVSRPDNWIEPHQTALMPALVREIITSALRDGWDPTVEGSAFEYAYAIAASES
jgi:hypothetical protein